jgi:hypothetical protein
MPSSHDRRIQTATGISHDQVLGRANNYLFQHEEARFDIFLAAYRRMREML